MPPRENKDDRHVLELPVKMIQVRKEISNNESHAEPERGRAPAQDVNREPLQRQRSISGVMRGRRPSVQEWENSMQGSTSGRGSPTRRGRSRERAEEKGEEEVANSTVTQGLVVNPRNGGTESREAVLMIRSFKERPPVQRNDEQKSAKTAESRSKKDS